MTPALGLFQGFGVEIEYMLVEARTLAVLPRADELLRSVAGSTVADVELGELAWSNELVLHLIELKTNGPARGLEPLPDAFSRHVARINALLAGHGGRLMPGGMHPWMDPQRDTDLWPHQDRQIYETYDRIFDCRGHDWSNLQSVHLNLPFCGAAEFGRLHAAIRLVLPLLPALAASSPFMDGRASGLVDTRVGLLGAHARRVPSVAGQLIPERAFTPEDYRVQILEPMYREIAPHDPAGILRHEWLNARGAIARFERDTIEIRLLDTQECPRADLAACALVSAALEAATQERWVSLRAQQAWEVERLTAILRGTVRDGEAALIADREYLEAFGLGGRAEARAGEVWRQLAAELALAASWSEPLNVILDEGPLARRLLRAAGAAPDLDRLRAIYGELCDCLACGRMFRGSA